MPSVATRIRFTEMELAHGIDAMLLKDFQVPHNLNTLIRSLVFIGIANSLGTGNYSSTEASLKAQNIMSQLIMRRNDAKQTKQLTQQVHQQMVNPTGQAPIRPIPQAIHSNIPQTQNTQSTINTADFSSNNLPHKELLKYLVGEDIAKGNRMLHTLALPDGVTIMDNLISENEDVSRITYEMFTHCQTLNKEEKTALEMYKNSH